MDPSKMKDLTAQMIVMTSQLRKVDCTVAPTDAELDTYNALREAAHDLLGAANHILEG